MPKTVLIVDDHPSFRASARRMLEAAGYRVLGEAQDGEAAVAAARRLRPDVVLLDVLLPDLDGFEVARRLLGARTSEPVPQIVLVSSHDSSDLGESALESGARGFVSKSDLSAEALAVLIT